MSFNDPSLPLLLDLDDALVLLLAALELEEAAPTVAKLVLTVVVAGDVEGNAESLIVAVALNSMTPLEEAAGYAVLRLATEVNLDTTVVVLAALSPPPPPPLICVGLPYSTDPPPSIAGNA